MTLDLSSLWVSTWHELGALHAEKLSDYLREVNAAWAEPFDSAQGRGRKPEKWITGVFTSLELALEKNRQLKRTFNRPPQEKEISRQGAETQSSSSASFASSAVNSSGGAS